MWWPWRKLRMRRGRRQSRRQLESGGGRCRGLVRCGSRQRRRGWSGWLRCQQCGWWEEGRATNWDCGEALGAFLLHEQRECGGCCSVMPSVDTNHCTTPKASARFAFSVSFVDPAWELDVGCRGTQLNVSFFIYMCTRAPCESHAMLAHFFHRQPQRSSDADPLFRRHSTAPNLSPFVAMRQARTGTPKKERNKNTMAHLVDAFRGWRHWLTKQLARGPSESGGD